MNVVSRLTFTSWPSLRPVSGCTLTLNWPIAAAESRTWFLRVRNWELECIRLKWWSGTDTHTTLIIVLGRVFKHKSKSVLSVARGDHTSADSYLTVLPRGTEFVVFSIDGSFAASVSIMGSDPKVRAGAVDVVRWGLGFSSVPLNVRWRCCCWHEMVWFVRHWQDLGYLIVYVTGRPDMQKQRVVAWLSQHNFPHGIVSFCDGLVHDPLRHKANFLKCLITEVREHRTVTNFSSVAQGVVGDIIFSLISDVWIVNRSWGWSCLFHRHIWRSLLPMALLKTSLCTFHWACLHHRSTLWGDQRRRCNISVR